MIRLGDIQVLGWILDTLLSYQDKKKIKVNDAIAAIHTAWTRTYDYLKNQDGEYVPNQELSDLWNEAAKKTRLVNPDLATDLQHKSRYWIHPELPRQERVLLLKEIVDELERLEKRF